MSGFDAAAWARPIAQQVAAGFCERQSDYADMAQHLETLLATKVAELVAEREEIGFAKGRRAAASQCPHHDGELRRRHGENALKTGPGVSRCEACGLPVADELIEHDSSDDLVPLCEECFESMREDAEGAS